MKQIRRSEPCSGGMETAGANMVGFMTRWGDGFFDVQVLEDDAGQLLTVGVVLNHLAEG